MCLCVCVCICVSVLRFQNSQRNLYWGQPGASYWSAAQYKQLVRCTKSVQCTKAGINSRITVPRKVCALRCQECAWESRTPARFVVLVFIYLDSEKIVEIDTSHLVNGIIHASQSYWIKHSPSNPSINVSVFIKKENISSKDPFFKMRKQILCLTHSQIANTRCVTKSCYGTLLPFI